MYILAYYINEIIKSLKPIVKEYLYEICVLGIMMFFVNEIIRVVSGYYKEKSKKGIALILIIFILAGGIGIFSLSRGKDSNKYKDIKIAKEKEEDKQKEEEKELEEAKKSGNTDAIKKAEAKVAIKELFETKKETSKGRLVLILLMLKGFVYKIVVLGIIIFFIGEVIRFVRVFYKEDSLVDINRNQEESKKDNC